MRENIAKYAEKFINLEIVALAFLLPLFFLPITVEFFEFNKLILLTVAVILGFLAWGLKAFSTGNLGIRHSPIDFPIIMLWITTLVTTIFSDSWLLSVIGQYARWHPSLISVTIFTLFFFLASWNLRKETLRWLTYALLASASIAIVSFWPQYFGINLLEQSWSAEPTFTPLGSPTTLSLFLGVVSGLALRELLVVRKPMKKILLTIFLMPFPATLALLNTPTGWATLAVSIIIALATSSAELLDKSKWYVLTTLIISAVFVSIVLIPPLLNKSTFLNTNPPKEISLDLQTSWSISATSFRQKPFWGSGPSTFLMDFTRYKPLRFNQTVFWTLRFEKPLSEYLRAFAEEGILGVFAWLFLIIVFIKAALRNENRQLLSIGAATLAGLFLTSATIVSTFLLFLALTSINARARDTLQVERSKATKGVIVLLSITVLLAILGFHWLYRSYTAEVLYRKSLTTQEGQEVYNLQVRTIQKFPWRAAYHLSLSRTSFLLANGLAGKENPTEEDTENIKILIAQAISEARQATDLYPLSVGNWESLAQIYRSLIGLAGDAETWTADSFQRAITLDLFNPLLRISFGGFHYQLGQYEQAVDQFRAAVNLKPDHANAHYNLGRGYKELGKTDQAIQELELALKLTTPEAEGYKEAQQVLNELKQQKE